MAASILEIRDLRMRYQDSEVIRGLNMRIDAGTIYALLGGNGAGKTTTINCIMGFVAPSAGEIMLDGDSTANDPVRTRKLLAYLPENVSLYSYLTGAENLIYFCALAEISLGKPEARTLLDSAGLQRDFQNKRVTQYSKGMRQKVGLAIANAKDARLMLLDEPTSGLDPAAANDFASSLRQARAAGMSILMATHDLFNAVQVADKIGIMKEGVLVEEFEANAVSHQELERKYLLHTRGIQ